MMDDDEIQAMTFDELQRARLKLDVMRQKSLERIERNTRWSLMILAGLGGLQELRDLPLSDVGLVLLRLVGLV